MRLCITGADGFVGRSLCNHLASKGHDVVRVTRQGRLANDLAVGDIGSRTDWSDALRGIDVVIHLAARVHVLDRSGLNVLNEFRNTNVDGTLSLARQAAALGVRRFIFLSSIKVNGESTIPGVAFEADSSPAPSDPYALSKLEAEDGLREICRLTGMEYVVIRPPLVYGPYVKANFLVMVGWLLRGVILPLGAVSNKRSFVALANLISLIVSCLDHPAAANQVLLVSDGQDLSTSELLRRMGRALGKPARLISVPMWVLAVGTSLVGRKELYQRLCGNLQIDISKTRRLLNWTPPESVDEGLRQTAEWVLSRRQSGSK